MSEFDKWWEENYMNVSADRTEAEDIYNLGVESQQSKIDILEVQLKGAEDRAKLILDHKNKMVDELQKENDRLNIWYKNVKLQLENKQIDCDRSDRETDELKKKYDAMHNAFTVADDCRKDWHESYMSVRKERDELQGRIDDHDLKLELFINELEKTCREDKDNKIDYWRGFSECADSSIKVFYRDVGFINLKGNKDGK